MKRRELLGMLAAVLALDPERLLWVPGKKLISIPEPLKNRSRVVAGLITINGSETMLATVNGIVYQIPIWT